MAPPKPSEWRTPSGEMSSQMITLPTREELDNKISDLTSQLHEFSTMNTQLKQENARLRAENESMKSQLSGPTRLGQPGPQRQQYPRRRRYYFEKISLTNILHLFSCTCARTYHIQICTLSYF